MGGEIIMLNGIESNSKTINSHEKLKISGS